ncbi:putative exodeoxyribonuclease 8 [Vibrio phage 1.100.O._10N.261.45.C3]|nr:putative exodeoxyribonuclease 8 [Vibrio phage 1.100.O._10N.261.45.C3]
MANLTTLLTNDEYRAQKGTSKSELDLAHDSVALLEWNKNNPAPGSESVDLGTHVHCALLEPDVFKKDYVKMPEFGTSKGGKESADAFIERIGDSKIVLDTETYLQVCAMRDSVLHHPVANMLLTSKGISEASIFGEITISDGTKMRVKARPDRIVDHSVFNQHILIDVKKCASIDEFAKSVIGFRYNVQQAFYSDIYEQYSGHKPRFIFIVVGEKRAIGRHPVRVWELPDRIVDIGRSDYLSDLELVREYEEFGCGLDVEQLFIPEYLMRKS